MQAGELQLKLDPDVNYDRSLYETYVYVEAIDQAFKVENVTIDDEDRTVVIEVARDPV